MLQYAAYLMNLPLVEFRAIKRAVRILVRAGLTPEDALQIVVEAHTRRYADRQRVTAIR